MEFDPKNFVDLRDVLVFLRTTPKMSKS